VLAQSRAARLLAGVLVVVLAVPLVLSTPWAKTWVFWRVVAWAHGHGLDIRASKFDYHLRSLRVSVEGLTVAELPTPGQPFARAARLEIDLAASALRGRPNVDSIRLQDARLVLDKTTRRPRSPGAQSARAAGTTLPSLTIDTVQIDRLHLDIGLGDEDEVRVAVDQVSATLQGRGPGTLEGAITAAGGVAVSFGDGDVRIAFDRADAQVALDPRSRVTGSLTASSPVGDLRAEGSVPLALDDPLDLRYEGVAALEEIHHWWSGAPAWTGRVNVKGEVHGPLRAPAAAYTASSTDLRWPSVARTRLDAAGHVSSDGLVVDRAAIASGRSTLDGQGTLAFRADQRSVVTGRWNTVGADTIAALLSRSPGVMSGLALSGSATLSWTGPRPGVATVAGRVEAAAAGAAPEESARGTVVADGANRQWRLSYRQTLDGDTTGTLLGQITVNDTAILDSAISGSLTVQARDVGDAMAHVQRLGLAVPARAADVGSERVVLDGRVTGTLAAPRLEGTIDADGIRTGPVDGVHLHGALTIDTHGLTMSALDLESSGNRAVVSGALPWTRGSGYGTFEAHLEDMTPLARALPAAWQPRGLMDVSGEWTGTMRRPGVHARVSGTELAVNGLAFDTVSASASFLQGELAIDDLRATQPAGTLTGSGSWNLTNKRVTADLAGRNLTLAVLMPSEDGTLETRPRLADVSFDARIAEGVARFTAGAPSYGALLDGQLGLDGSWPFEARLALDRSDVAAIGRLAGAGGTILDGITATADATLEASGVARDLAATRATLLVTQLNGTVEGRPVAVAQAGRLQLQAERVRVAEPVRVTWGSTSVSLTEAPGPDGQPGVAVSMEAPLAELATLAAEMLPDHVTAAGTVTAEIFLGDRVTDIQPTGQMTVKLESLTRDGHELARDATLVADADLTTVRVREVRGTVLGGPLEAGGTAPVAWFRTGHDAGRAPDDQATFWLRSGAAGAHLVALLRDNPPAVSGTLSLTIEGTATAPRLDALRATLRDESVGLTVGSFTLHPQRPTELRLEGGLVHVDQFEWLGPESTVTASGSVALADGRDGQLAVSGNASLALATLLVPARVDGRARFDLDVSGPPGQRELLGTIGIEDGTLVEPSWRLAMADWSGSVVLERDRIEVTGLHGQFNGGEATIEGRFPVGDAGARAQSLALKVRGAFLDVPRGLRSQLDANLEWSHAGGGARLSGDATVTARTYREPVTEIARLAAALIDGSGGVPLQLPAILAGTALDLRLSTVGPLAITNSVARVELLPDLQLVGTLSRPALRGQVALADEGRIQFGGRRYRLRDSRIEFSPERGLMPRLAVSGETRVAEYTVFLRLSGTASAIETALSSDPPLGERELQTLLVTGQRETIGRDSATSEQNAVGAVSGEVLGLAGQFVGIDTVTVSTTDDLALVSSDVDPALRLTVSRRIGRRFELVLSDNLDDNELTWVIIYRPRPGFEFRLLSRDNTEFTGEFRQEIFFGPGVSPPRSTTPPQVARDRVAEVTISGELGFNAAEVLSVTSLDVGDRFDFARWLEDRERLARFYQRRGYYAARIVPTRRPLETGGGELRVALDYRVTRGPRTVLSITGYVAPPEVEQRLRQAWSDSVLVELLDGDLTRVMREHLVDAGYLRAVIEVQVDTSQPGLVTAGIRVDPGVRSTIRRIAFSGNTVLSSKALLAVVQADAGLESPWRHPAPLLEVVQAAYAARGYLATTATADAIEFAGDTATLPVRIVEGPEVRITSLNVTGTDRLTPSEAAAATGLVVGATYRAGSDQAARAALERHYRNLGHRDVAVDLQSAVSPAEGRADIAVTVREGPRHVVRAVQTTGVQSTRDVTVERATRIEAGSPASPAVADAIRRQLYDIGTFRSADVTFVPVDGTATASTVPVDAVVTLQETKRFLLLYGIEATNQYQSLFDQRVTSGGVAVDLRDRNFLGRGWTLGAGVRYEPSFESARVLGTVPRLGSRRIRTNVYADTRDEERARTEDLIFRDIETTFTVEQRWRPWTPVELSWGYRYDRRTLRFIDATDEDNRADFTFYLGSLASAVVIDRRDSLFDARRGWLMSTTAELGLQSIGSDFDYLRSMVRASYYHPLGPVTLASNIRWGDLVVFGGPPSLIVLDLLYTAGGTQTVRGYQQDTLSAYFLDPLDTGTPVPVGGSKLLVLNEEVRFPLFRLLSGAGFVDVGNTFTDEKGIVLGDLAVGAGVGLRIRTPLAPVRIDLGFPVRSRTGQTGVRWHFSIGQIF
jgi:outer membrane protein insertion porin family